MQKLGIETLPELEELVNFLVSKYNPERIILFGSYTDKTENKIEL